MYRKRDRAYMLRATLCGAYIQQQVLGARSWRSHTFSSDADYQAALMMTYLSVWTSMRHLEVLLCYF